MPRYDHIPKGKKEIKCEKTGEWILVDLDAENSEDLQILLQEKDATIKELEAKIEELEIQLQKQHNSKKK